MGCAGIVTKQDCAGAGGWGASDESDGNRAESWHHGQGVQTPRLWECMLVATEESPGWDQSEHRH